MKSLPFALVLAIPALLSGCDDKPTAEESAMAVATTAAPTESAQERADRLNAQADSGDEDGSGTQTELDDAGNPVEIAPGQPSMDEMREAVQRQEQEQAPASDAP